MKKDGQKKFVRYKEGAEMYSMSMRKFQDMAKDAGAIYKVGKMALVNCELFEMYLETFRIQKTYMRFCLTKSLDKLFNKKYTEDSKQCEVSRWRRWDVLSRK